MNNTLKINLYWSNTMLDVPLDHLNAPSLDVRLEETAASSFNNILLWSLHVNQANASKNIVPGDFTWNDTLLVSSQSGKPVFDPNGKLTKLADRLETLATAGKKIFFSIGAGSAGDFSMIKELYQTPSGQQTLETNFSALLESLPAVSGFDFDNEDANDPQDQLDIESSAWLTEMLTKLNATVTYCPYDNMTFWEQCLESVFAKLGTQPVAWFNLQCYGKVNNPIDWFNCIQQNQNSNGVGDPSSFIVPGYIAHNTTPHDPHLAGYCPDKFTSTISAYNQSNLGGGWAWNSNCIFNIPKECNGSIPSVQDYADAILRAFGGTGRTPN